MDPGENSSQSAFRHFMRLIVALEEVQIQGAKYIQSLASELEAFRRPPLTQSSPLLAKIFKEYPTSRLQSYVESGCCHMAAETARCQKLDAAFRNLDTHRLNVDELVGELREVCHSAEAALSSSIDVTPEAYLREDGNEDVFSETSPGSMPTGYLPCRRTEWIPNGNTSADHENDSSCGTEEEDSDGQSSPISGVEDKVRLGNLDLDLAPLLLIAAITPLVASHGNKFW